MTRFFHVQLFQRWHYWWQIQVHRHQKPFYQTNNHPKNKHKMLNKYHFIPSAYVNSAQQSSLMYWFFSYNRYDRILIKANLLSLATYILKKISSFWHNYLRVKKCFAFLSQNEYFSCYLETWATIRENNYQRPYLEFKKFNGLTQSTAVSRIVEGLSAQISWQGIFSSDLQMVSANWKG